MTHQEELFEINGFIQWAGPVKRELQGDNKMTTESETYQYVFNITAEHKPLMPDERDHFTYLMHRPDSTCRDLNTYGERLLGHPVYVIYVDNHYGLIGVNDKLLDYKYFLWNLGETPTDAKRWLFNEFLCRYYGNKRAPHRIINLVGKTFNAHLNWAIATINLTESLKLRNEDLTEFMDSYVQDILNGGGFIILHLTLVCWIKNMVQEKLLQFDPDRSTESILQEFTSKRRLVREPKKQPEIKPKTKPERKPKSKPQRPPQE